MTEGIIEAVTIPIMAKSPSVFRPAQAVGRRIGESKWCGVIRLGLNGYTVPTTRRGFLALPGARFGIAANLASARPGCRTLPARSGRPPPATRDRIGRRAVLVATTLLVNLFTAAIGTGSVTAGPAGK